MDRCPICGNSLNVAMLCPVHGASALPFSPAPAELTPLEPVLAETHEHSWQHLRYWQEKEKSPHPPDRYHWKRVDEFFCSKCLDTDMKVVVASALHPPAWWNQ